MSALTRRYPIRFTSTMITLAFLVAEGVLRNLGCGLDNEILMAAVALVGAGVAGDTVRPSGMAAAPRE